MGLGVRMSALKVVSSACTPYPEFRSACEIPGTPIIWAVSVLHFLTGLVGGFPGSFYGFACLGFCSLYSALGLFTCVCCDCTGFFCGSAGSGGSTLDIIAYRGASFGSFLLGLF